MTHQPTEDAAQASQQEDQDQHFQAQEEDLPPWRYIPEPGEEQGQPQEDVNMLGLEGGLEEIPPVAAMEFSASPDEVTNHAGMKNDLFASMTSLVEKAQEALGRHYGAQTGRQQALDPQLTGSLLEIGLALLGACKDRGTPTQQIVERARQGGTLVQVAVRRHVRQSLIQAHGPGGWRQHNGEAITQALLEAAREADQQDLAQLVLLTSEM
jgi:hypothetical protein